MSDLHCCVHVFHGIIEREGGGILNRVPKTYASFLNFGAFMIFGQRPARGPWLGRRGRNILLWVIGLLALQSSCGWVGPPTIVITAEEFRFTPTRIEWLSDRPLRLVIRNQGRERHVFHSPELFGPAIAVTWHQPIVPLQEANAVVLEPGESIELSFELSPGLYPFRCWIKGHTGMEGTIVVKGLFSG